MKASLLIFLVIALSTCYSPKNELISETTITDSITVSSDSPFHSNRAEIVRLALDRQCGECHNSNNETANLFALEIFDCDTIQWALHKLADHIPGLEDRTMDSDDFSELEKAAIKRLVIDLEGN